METGKPRLSIQNLSVSFGSNRALDGLDLDIPPASIVALLGANGSGKSTTVKALSGINPIEPGATIELNGRGLDASSLNPVTVRARGIRVVHQEAPLIADLTVAEVVALHLGFPTSAGFVRSAELNRRAQELLSEFDIHIEVDRLCRTLSPSDRALVSLAIAIGDISVSDAVLVLDEATASLSTVDAEKFLVKVRQLADRGLSVLLVTHRLPEVRAHCDAIVVLRDGKVAERMTRSTFDEVEVVRAMVGPESRAEARNEGSTNRPVGNENRLVVRGLTGGGVHDVDFVAEHGGILGLTGRAGGGASELLRVLAGLDETRAGNVSLGGVEVKRGEPRKAIASRMFYLSADRLIEGGVGTMSVSENITLPKTERYGWGKSKAKKDIATIMSLLDVRPADPSVAFGGLSGGNQQKVLLGRWLLLNPRVFLLDDPTAGVDPNTREVIFRNLRSLAATGTTILLRSTEPEQLARLCERVLVFRDGHVVRELVNEDVNIEEISVATYA